MSHTLLELSVWTGPEYVADDLMNEIKPEITIPYKVLLFAKSQVDELMEGFRNVTVSLLPSRPGIQKYSFLFEGEMLFSDDILINDDVILEVEYDVNRHHLESSQIKKRSTTCWPPESF